MDDQATYWIGMGGEFDLGAKEARILDCICRQGGLRGSVRIKKATLAEYANCTIRTVDKALRRFEIAGIVRVTRGMSAENGYEMNMYTIERKDLIREDRKGDRGSGHLTHAYEWAAYFRTHDHDHTGEMDACERCQAMIAQHGPVPPLGEMMRAVLFHHLP